MGMSARDKCFKEAIEEYERMTGKDLGIKHQSQWVKYVKEVEGKLQHTWERLEQNKHWRALVNSIKKTQRIFKEGAPARADGAKNPVQWREPDMTIKTNDGREKAAENKYEGDKPGTKEGMSGSKQLDDYDEINKQNGKKTIVFDPKSCRCNEKKRTEEHRVTVVVPQYGMYFVMSPHALPIGQAAGAAVGEAAPAAVGAQILEPAFGIPW